MRKLIIKLSSVVSLALLLSSCDGFLDKRPESMLTPENYLTTEANLSSYIYGIYTNQFPTHGVYEWGTFQSDNNTDNMAYVTPSDIFAPGYWRVSESGGEYDSFGQLYQINYFLQVVTKLYGEGRITGNDALIRQCLGEAYFFRAWDHFTKLKTFGDCPIVDEVLPDDMDVLVAKSKRYPRNEVSRFILSDLDKAMELLMDVPEGGTNRISKDCAHLFKSRVALYEGTWLKYFKGTAFVPNGPDWPGARKDYNANYQYPSGGIDEEVEFFLSEAMRESKIVADKYRLTSNNGKFQGSASEPSNSYYDMFADTDMSKYREVLLWRKYDLNVVSNATGQWGASSNCGYGTTKSMIDAFVMANGLPVYASGSGYPGDEDLKRITEGRDTRAVLFVKKPGDANLHSDPAGPASKIEPWPDITAGAESNRYTTGYALRKGLNFDGRQTLLCTVGSIIFRAAEAYLNYIEACYESTGSIDATADSYWRAIRRRAGVNEDYNVTIAATDMNIEALEDWGAYSGGKVVDATLFSIRRERRCEFMAENMRNADIRRWRSMDQMIDSPYCVLGMNLWGNKDLSEFGDLKENVNVSPRDFSKYLAPYHIISNNHVYDGYRWTMAHYLSPIAIQHFLITGGGNAENSSLYQNPGWPLVANEPPVSL